MDNFKDVNDRYGHLVGDEILRNIGNLLQASIRHEDEAFRWGGDEFVILFHNQHSEVASKRMTEIEARLQRFPRARLRRAADLLQLGNRRCRMAACCARRWTKPTGTCTRGSASAPRAVSPSRERRAGRGSGLNLGFAGELIFLGRPMARRTSEGGRDDAPQFPRAAFSSRRHSRIAWRLGRPGADATGGPAAERVPESAR